MTDITRKFQAGEVVPCWAEFKTWAGAYVSPDQGVTIVIKNPSGTAVVLTGELTVDDMSESATGKWVYYYDTTAAVSPVGWWTFMATGTDGTGDDEKIVMVPGGFQLE